MQQIIEMPIAEVHPYPANPRNNDLAVEKVAESIRLYGFDGSISVDRNHVIIAGHTRYKAAVMLGMKTIPVHVRDDLTDEQVRALRLADNRVAEFSKWDEELLRRELDALGQDGLNLDDLGFSEKELTEMFGAMTPETTAKRTEEELDEAPPPPEKAMSRRGEVYALGRHRLMCGDSTDRAQIACLMGGGSADLLLTDPPYNVDISNSQGMKIENDNLGAAEFRAFITAFFAAASSAMKPGAAAYVFHASRTQSEFESAMTRAGIPVREQLVWVKNAFVMGRQDYQWRHELVFYGWKDGAAHKWNSDRRQSTIVELAPESLVMDDRGRAILTIGGTTYAIDPKAVLTQDPTTLVFARKPLKNDIHPDMKPVAILQYFMRNSSDHGDVVLDPCGGSGSTLVAADDCGRTCRTMEIDPRYCDAIRMRWARLQEREDWQEATPVVGRFTDGATPEKRPEGGDGS